MDYGHPPEGYEYADKERLVVLRAVYYTLPEALRPPEINLNSILDAVHALTLSFEKTQMR